MPDVAGGSAAPETPTPAAADRGRVRPVSPPDQIDWRERVLSLREGSIIIVTIVVAIYFSVQTGSFFTSANFKTLLPYVAPFAILGAGEVFVMILGEIDLSIGGTYLLAPYLFYKIASGGVPLIPAVIIAMLACVAVGAINGFFTAIVGISSFVATLGMLFALEGLTLIISHGEPVNTPGAQTTTSQHSVTHIIHGVHIQLQETVIHIGTFAKVFGAGVYSEIIWALLIVVGLQIVLTFTRWGLHTVAVGSNKLGSAEAGVKVRLVMIRNFILCAMAGGLVGILESVRAGTVQPDTAGANEILFYGIAAAVIGGTLLAGGSGTVVGALIGALFLGILKDGLVLQGVNANYLLFYTGLAIILAMSINVYVQRLRRGTHRG
jgi:simple sugar transport system permease protein